MYLPMHPCLMSGPSCILKVIHYKGCSYLYVFDWFSCTVIFGLAHVSTNAPVPYVGPKLHTKGNINVEVCDFFLRENSYVKPAVYWKTVIIHVYWICLVFFFSMLQFLSTMQTFLSKAVYLTELKCIFLNRFWYEFLLNIKSWFNLVYGRSAFLSSCVTPFV